MKYAVALAIAATGAMASKNVTYVTEVVESYVTYCPAPTEITHGTQTYTVTEPTTLTITDCPCTVTKPVIPTSTVICHDCPEEPTAVPPPPPHTNGTVPGVPQPTGSPVPPPGEEPTEPPAPVPTAGAAKIAGLSGVAGLAGLAAFFL